MRIAMTGSQAGKGIRYRAISVSCLGGPVGSSSDHGQSVRGSRPAHASSFSHPRYVIIGKG